jgi:hypothetical protein
MKTLSMILISGILLLLFAGVAKASEDERYRGPGGPVVEFYGVIEDMPQKGYEGIWIISGKKVVVTRDTFIKEKHGTASPGAYVEVKARYSDDTYTAYKIEIKSGDFRKTGYPGKFYGTIESIPEGRLEGIWIINGREVLVTPNTKIEEEYGRVTVGAYVEVKGNYIDRIFTAYEIEVKRGKR